MEETTDISKLMAMTNTIQHRKEFNEKKGRRKGKEDNGRMCKENRKEDEPRTKRSGMGWEKERVEGAKKPELSQQNADKLEGKKDAAIPESDRDGVVLQFAEDGLQWLIELLSEGDDDEAKQEVQEYVAALKDKSGSPVEAKRKDKVNQV